MEYVEAEGSSIDDAIERAVAKLGVTRDEVDVEILGNSTKGLFGLGGKKAKVRATLRAPMSFSDCGDSAPTSSAPQSQPRPARTTRARKNSRSASGDGERRRRTPREDKDDRPVVDIDAETLELARAVLERTVQLIGTEATVRVVRDDLGTCLVVDGDESGLLIGRRGQTLDALEYMINRVASRDTRHTTHLVVDSQDYRQRRREALEALAQRMGERAEQRRKPVTMNPMSPRDRRIVHLSLQNNPALETRSAGEGYFRKLLIIPRR